MAKIRHSTKYLPSANSYLPVVEGLFVECSDAKDVAMELSKMKCQKFEKVSTPIFVVICTIQKGPLHT
jgi:hypothetical protein